MQRRTVSWLGAALALLPLAGQADTMDYTFVDLAYIDSELDNGLVDVDGDGFALRGSLAIHPNFFVFAGYQDLGFDRGLDATAWHVGAGARWPLSDKLDIVGRAGIIQQELEAGRGSQDDDGFLLGARLRAAIAPRFELEGGLEYVDLDDAGDDTSLVVEGRYFFLEQLSGGLLVQFGDDVTTIGLGARLTF
jgi:hypothetical protein